MYDIIFFFFLLLFQVNIVGTMLRGESKFFRSIYNICLELFFLGMEGKGIVGLLKINLFYLWCFIHINTLQ